MVNKLKFPSGAAPLKWHKYSRQLGMSRVIFVEFNYLKTSIINVHSLKVVFTLIL